MSSAVRIVALLSVLAAFCATVLLQPRAAERGAERAAARSAEPVRRTSQAVAAPRLVLLYAPCTVSTSTLGPYNPAVDYTPALSEFARDAVVFRRHQGESGRSAIDYAALFTGTQAMRHRVFSNMDRLPDDAYTIGEAFRDAGYDTFFWAAHPFASKDLNFAQGVDDAQVYDGNSGMANRHYSERPFLRADDPRFRAILDRLRRDPTYKAFVLTNFSVTHSPYPPQYRTAFCTAFPQQCAGLSEEDFNRFGPYWRRYFGALSLYPSPDTAQLSEAEFATMTRVVEILYQSNFLYLDSVFGAVVQAIRAAGLFDSSIIAFTADHGEVLYRPTARLAWSHGFQLAPEVLHVPLLISAPGLAPGSYEGVSRSIDVLPTLLGLAGIPLSTTDPPMGVDLLDADPPAPLLAFSHSALNHPVGDRRPKAEDMLVGVREFDAIYRHDPARDDELRFAVADWSVDPTLLSPQAEQSPLFDELMAYKAALVRAYNGEDGEPLPRATLGPADLERLRQLGYAQ